MSIAEAKKLADVAGEVTAAIRGVAKMDYGAGGVHGLGSEAQPQSQAKGEGEHDNDSGEHDP